MVIRIYMMPDIRKVQFYGDGFFVSLPKEWVKKHNLKVRDRVSVIVEDKLIVKPTSKNETSTTSLQYMGRSFFVYLPVKWVRKHKIKAGDEMLVMATSKKVVIVPLKGKVLKKLKMNLREFYE